MLQRWQSSSNANAFVSEAECLMFKSRAGQIRHSVANGMPLLRHFFTRSCVVHMRYDPELGPANSLHASAVIYSDYYEMKGQSFYILAVHSYFLFSVSAPNLFLGLFSCLKPFPGHTILREVRGVVFTATLIAWSGFNPLPGHVLTSLDKTLYDGNLCLVTSNKLQIHWTR